MNYWTGLPLCLWLTYRRASWWWLGVRLMPPRSSAPSYASPSRPLLGDRLGRTVVPASPRVNQLDDNVPDYGERRRTDRPRRHRVGRNYWMWRAGQALTGREVDLRGVKTL